MRSGILPRLAGAAVWIALVFAAFPADRWVYRDVAGPVAERTGDKTWRFGRPSGGRSTGLLELLYLLKRMGHFFFTILIAVTIVLIAPQRRRQVVVLLLAVGVTAAVGQGLVKPAIAKIRPDAILSAQEAEALVRRDGPEAVIVVRGNTLNYGSAYFRAPFSGYREMSGLTFPSGHTALAFASFVVLAAAFPRARWWFLALACGVGVSRVLMGEHFVSDVVAGAGVGYACARALLRIPRVRRAMQAPAAPA